MSDSLRQTSRRVMKACLLNGHHMTRLVTLVDPDTKRIVYRTECTGCRKQVTVVFRDGRPPIVGGDALDEGCNGKRTSIEPTKEPTNAYALFNQRVVKVQLSIRANGNLRAQWRVDQHTAGIGTICAMDGEIHAILDPAVTS